MELKVYNRDLIRENIVSDKFSMMITKRYDSVDSFQINTTLTEHNVKALKKDNIIRLNDDTSLYYITHINKIEEAGSSELIIKGYGLEHYLSRRVVTEYYYEIDTVVNHLRNLLNMHVVNPKNPKRKIPNFDVDIRVKESTKIPYQVDEDTTLLTVLNELCRIDDLGYKIEFKGLEVASLVIYQGEDKTVNQDKHRPVIFSPERDNIIEQRIVEDYADEKNVLTVIGQGEEDDKFTTIVGDTEAEGLDRKEGYINAQDLDPENEGQWLSPDEYRELLGQRGKIKIKDYKPIQTYESRVHPNSNLTYKEDFDVGDLVEFHNDNLGIRLSTRIVEIQEIYETHLDINITFGTMHKTIADSMRENKEEANKVRGGGKVSVEGEKGKPGIGLEYIWKNTQLGIKREDETFYQYVDLKGEKGDRGSTGLTGKDGTGLEYNWDGTKLGIKREDEYTFKYTDLKGDKGPTGKDGIGLDFSWDGTKLGVKREDENSYKYVNLKGEKGERGERGLPGKDGTDATVTKDKVIQELGYTPLSDEDLKVHLEKDVTEDMSVREFQNGITISAVANRTYFPTINKFGVVITYINKIHGGYGQLFITSDGDTWTRRTNSLTSWGKWYSVKKEIDKKADKDKVVTSVNGQTGDITIEDTGGGDSTIVDENTGKEYKIVAKSGEFFFRRI